MTGSKRATLRDVAEASGVSRATVSFVLNNAPNQTISPATRERVHRAARELDYTPHGLAKALREGASRIVVLNVESGLEGNYSRSFVRGLDDELAAHDHVLLVRHGHIAPESTQQVLDAIAPRAIVRFGEAYLTGHELDDSGGGWRDGLAGNAALQLGYLAERGHTRLAMALPDTDPPLRETRLRFSHEIVRDLGLPDLVTMIVPRPRAEGARALRGFLADHAGVTAVAAYDDDVALRTLTALQDLGRTAPDDLAIIGFDDTEYGSLTTPALTTVHVDAEAHGRIAARHALGLDTEGIAPTPGHVIIRQSA